MVLLTVGGVVAGAGVQTALATPEDSGTEAGTIDSCTNIEESGIYGMTGDITDGGDGISEATDDDLSGIAAARFDPWLTVPALSDAFAEPPQDHNEDSLDEDVNGDGAVDVGDAQALFARVTA